MLSSSQTHIRKFIYFLAVGFGSGLLPKAPGTWGTLAALPLYGCLMLVMPTLYLPVTLLLTLVGISICDVVVKELQRDDPGEVVWDEICGYLITMFALPFNLFWMILGFLVFRFFDILKPWPINWSEQRFKGGFGVMIDDVLAAFYSSFMLHVLLFFWP